MRNVMNAVIAAMILVCGTAAAQSLGQIAVFHEKVGWIGQDAANAAADEILSNTTSTDIMAVNLDESASFLADSTGDGDVDVFFTFGYLPETVYAPGNAEPDDSIIEKYIEDGNLYLNTADYIFYVTLGGGANEVGGLQNVTDSAFDMWTDGNNVAPTADGSKYLPSLEGFQSNRSFRKEQVEADENWDYAVVFAEGPLGEDPAIIQHADYMGMVGIVMQVANDNLPRGAVVTELFNNWLPDAFPTTSVDPIGKSASLWGSLKSAE
ncbi:MAG: hypothetical protein OXT69_01635 [Candidatus Poribacteria bacterium]|nr:hypothetical protein [Candidatus Poribacteria bacterium]